MDDRIIFLASRNKKPNPPVMDVMRLITRSFLCVFIAVSASAQVEPQAGGWKTWVLSSGSQLHLPPPPAASTELQAVRSAMAGADANALARVAYWDAGSPAYQWIAAASNQLVTRNICGTAIPRSTAHSLRSPV